MYEINLILQLNLIKWRENHDQSYSESEIPSVMAEILCVLIREAERDGGGEGGGGGLEGEILRLFTSIILPFPPPAPTPITGAGRASGLGSVGEGMSLSPPALPAALSIKPCPRCTMVYPC